MTIRVVSVLVATVACAVARLPADPGIRARAAEMLIKQRHPELARKVTGTKPAK